ncbi:MAG: hypothetical protein HZC17_01075 [Candidatus Omnitrophica bacterium]|nr:hypothetical protein [Candidatus Omnitrophota bacterium]
MKKLLVLFLAAFVFTGCAKNDLLAQYYLYRAENAFQKAYNLRIKPNADFERTQYYQKAHDLFLKAYRLNPKYFSLTKIDQAHDACLRLEDSAGAQLFQQFGEDYARAHPREVEYGDVMVGLE